LKPDEQSWRPHNDLCLPRQGVTLVREYGPVIGCWLNKDGSPSPPYLTKIEAYQTLSTILPRTAEMLHRSVPLIVSLACFVAWIVFGFVVPVGVGVVHALLGVSAILFVRWWGLTR